MKKENENSKEPKTSEGTPDKSISTGRSTTQGGSDHGQGSSYLAGKAYKQGRTKDEGSNYKNEEDDFGDYPDMNNMEAEADK